MSKIEFSGINEILPVPCIGKKFCTRDSNITADMKCLYKVLI